MENIDFLNLFQGVATLAAAEPDILIGRIFLIFLGCLLIYLGKKGVLEALLMVPMGLGMAAVNAGVLFLPDGTAGTLFLDALASEGDGSPEVVADYLQTLQVNWLQPVYNYSFANGLIACLVFLGIGVLLDVGFVMARPFTSMFIALFAEFGTFVAFPLGLALGLPTNGAAAAATIGGADGPMILFASLILAPELFVPITVVAYLYLGLTYGGYPYMIRLLIPKHMRGLRMPIERKREITSGQKIVFCVVICILLCLLFPVAAPLFLSLFLGVVVREAGLVRFAETLSGPVLYGATFFLGLLLGVLCEASTILNPEVLILLFIGILALFFSGLGGLAAGVLLYYITGKRFNPVIGIAGVSCVPTCAKVAQKCVAEVTPDAVVLPHSLGASISGVITSAIIAGIFMTVVGVSL